MKVLVTGSAGHLVEALVLLEQTEKVEARRPLPPAEVKT
jgi:hypothetical protein